MAFLTYTFFVLCFTVIYFLTVCNSVRLSSKSVEKVNGKNQLDAFDVEFNFDLNVGSHLDIYADTGCAVLFDPPFIQELVEDDTAEITLSIKCPGPGQYEILSNITSRSPENLRLLSDDSVLLSEVNSTTVISVKALKYGRVYLDFISTFSNSSTEILLDNPKEYEVAIVFQDDTLLNIYTLILGVLIVVYKFGYGCRCDLQVVYGILKKPYAPAVGFACQFLLMAPLALGVAELFSLDAITGLGLIAIGSCPGGGASNVFAMLFGLNVELSLTMSTISTVAAMGMTPLWIWALGPVVTGDDTDITIPVEDVLMSLLITVLPAIPGLVLVHFKPKWAEKIGRMVKPMTGVMGIVAIGMGLYVYWKSLSTLELNTIMATLVLPCAGYAFGTIIAKILCLGWNESFTIGLETGFQNFSLALVMLQVSLPRPEADIAGAVPLVHLFLSAAVPAIIWTVWILVKICKEKKSGIQNVDTNGDIVMNGKDNNLNNSNYIDVNSHSIDENNEWQTERF